MPLSSCLGTPKLRVCQTGKPAALGGVPWKVLTARPPRRRVPVAAPARSSTWRSRLGLNARCRPPTSTRSAAGSSRRRTRVARGVPGDLRPHRRRHAEGRRAALVAASAEDFAADGVVYAEVRYARVARHRRADPRGGGPRGQGGFRRAAGRATGSQIGVRALLTAMRRGPVHRDRRAGGAPATRGGRLRHRRRRGGVPADPAPGRVRVPPPQNAHVTIHAGEAFGCRRSGRRSSGAAPTGSATACGSSTTSRPTVTGRARPARRLRARQARPAGDVPARPTCTPAPRRRSPSTRSGCSRRLGFRVTVNTDNRLMSGTSMTKEFALVEAFGYGWRDLRCSRSTR